VTRTLRVLVAVLVVAGIGGATVAFHVNYLFKVSQLGASYLDTEQLSRHEDVLTNRAPSPWQFRLLSEWLVAGARRLVAPAVAFVGVRLLWVWLALALAWRYYRALGLGPRSALLGLGLLCAAMTSAVHDSDLSLNTYGDLAFWMAGMVLIAGRRDAWLVMLVPLAVLNRETALLLPIVAGAVRLAEDRALGARVGRALAPAVAALTLGLVAFFAVRLTLGVERIAVLPAGHSAGLELLWYNLGRPHSYVFLLLSFGVLPLLAARAGAELPSSLRAAALAMLPIWIGVHLLFGVLAETRLFLVPIAVVVVPAALLAVAAESAARPV